MTRLDLEAIRARCDAATKGPWRVDGNTYDEDCNEHLAPYGLEGPNERMIWSSGGGEYSHPDMATAQFIAHTRADIPALLAYIDELVRERDEAREGRDLARERFENAIQSATRYAVERDKLKWVVDKTNEYIEQLRKVTEPEMQRHNWTVLQTATQAFSVLRGLLGNDQRWALDFPHHVQLELEELKEIKAERDEARREADRFRHGCAVEGDFVCPNEYAVSELTAERDEARHDERDEICKALEALKARVPAYLANSGRKTLKARRTAIDDAIHEVRTR